MHTSRTLIRFAIVFAFVISALPLWAAGNVPGVVNINTADAAQLSQLPRIGPALAERIVAFRKENGEMKKAEDLILVRGIGEKTFRLLEPFVVVQGKTTLSRKLRTAEAQEMLAAREKKSAPEGAQEKGAATQSPGPRSQG